MHVLKNKLNFTARQIDRIARTDSQIKVFYKGTTLKLSQPSTKTAKNRNKTTKIFVGVIAAQHLKSASCIGHPLCVRKKQFKMIWIRKVTPLAEINLDNT